MAEPHAAVLPPITNYEAERAILAAVLINNTVYPKVAGFLKSEHFAEPVHGTIYDACGFLIDQGRLADALTLKSHFDNDGMLQVVGGARYLAELSGAVVTVLGAEDYGRAVYDCWQRRHMLAQMEHFERDIRSFDIDRPASEIAADAVNSFSAVASEDGSATQRTRDVAEQIVYELDHPQPCYQTGIIGIDKAIGGGLYAEKLYGIVARKKMGKTMLLGSISYNMNQAGVTHMFINLEFSPKEVEQRNIARHCGFNVMRFLTGMGPDEKRAIADYAVTVPNNVIYERLPGGSFEDVRRVIANGILRYGIKGVVIDYLQLITGRSHGMTKTDFLDEVAQWLADSCRKNGLWCLLAAQENKDGTVRGGDGLALACDLLFKLRLTGVEAWLECMDARYIKPTNVYSSTDPGLLLVTETGPYFRSHEAPAVDPQSDLL